jgi:hypothetical protein
MSASPHQCAVEYITGSGLVKCQFPAHRRSPRGDGKWLCRKHFQVARARAVQAARMEAKR